MNINIIISNSNNKPIYEQIYYQIKKEIISGKLVEDELLPSIRTLAKDLRISVITTKRAYDELEKEGYIYTIPNKGTFVAKKNLEVIKESHLTEIERHIIKILEISKLCELSEEELFDMIKIINKED